MVKYLGSHRSWQLPWKSREFKVARAVGVSLFFAFISPRAFLARAEMIAYLKREKTSKTLANM